MKDDPENHLSIKLLFFEATAKGPLAIGAAVFALCLVLAARYFSLI